MNVLQIWCSHWNAKKSEIKSNMKVEEAPCTITLMNNAIMADIPEHNLVYTYEWNQFTNVYNKFGYYMLFNKGRMIVMLSQKDMPDDIKAAVPAYIKSHVDRNICKINF